jgi:hypothetical protein
MAEINEELVKQQFRDILIAAMRKAYLAGFMATAEGWNGEYPYEDSPERYQSDERWLKKREEDIAKLISDKPDDRQPSLWPLFCNHCNTQITDDRGEPSVTGCDSTHADCAWHGGKKSQAEATLCGDCDHGDKCRGVGFCPNLECFLSDVPKVEAELKAKHGAS